MNCSGIPSSIILHKSALRLVLYNRLDSRDHYIEMATIAITGIISRTGSLCYPKRKELPDLATSNGYHFAFFTDFPYPVREIHAESGSRNRKSGIKRRLPCEFLRFLVKGIYSHSFTTSISFLPCMAISGVHRGHLPDRETG